MKEEIKAMFNYYPNFKDCSLQTFDDVKDRKLWNLAKILVNNKENYIELDKLNKEGAWIYFSVNPMQPWKRDKESVIWVSSWICEIDWLDKDIQIKMIDNCPIYPSMIIESKSSFHLYWFAKDWTKEKRYDITNWLRNYFDWDPAVVDISRVLRLPWYDHCKNLDNRFLITIYWYTWEYYTEEQMLKSYSDIRSLSDIKNSVIQKETVISREIGWDYFRDRIKNMNTKNVLEKISWDKLVSWDVIEFRRNTNWTEQIWSNWKSTWCWLDTNWKIGSKTWWWPNWTNRVFWYGNCDWPKLSRRIKDNYPEMCESKIIPKKENKIVIIKEEDKDIDFITKTPYTWWLSSLDKKFGRFNTNTLIVTIGESQSWKTEFTYFQARKNADLGYKVCYIWLEMTKKNMILRIAQKRASVSKEERDNKTFTDNQKQIMKFKYDELNNYKNLDIFNLWTPTIEQIVEFIKEKQKEWYELFYIDNLWFIIWQQNEIELTTLAVRELKQLTNQLPISINLLHHFNKWNTKEREGPRGMASIRSSWKIENDVDYVIQVWRDLSEDVLEEDRSMVWIYLQKDRIWWDPSNCRIKFNKWEYIENIKEDKVF